MGFSSHQKIGAAIQQLGYGFADGIYPEYRTLVKTVSKGSNPKNTVY
jgi:hypothetical protein